VRNQANALSIQLGLIISGSMVAGTFGLYLFKVDIDNGTAHHMTSSPQDFILPGALLVLALVIGGVAVLFGSRWNKRLTELQSDANRKKVAAAMAAKAKEYTHFFSCALCGYDWTWTGVGSPPFVTGMPRNPSAMLLGAQKLEEERKQREQDEQLRRDQATSVYWQSQQHNPH
jgi:hypothetical protein